MAELRTEGRKQGLSAQFETGGCDFWLCGQPLEHMTEIEQMKRVDPRTVERGALVQRNSVHLDPNAPREERLRDFIRQIKNPYCYLDGKTVVKISFSDTDTTMEDCLAHYLQGV